MHLSKMKLSIASTAFLGFLASNAAAQQQPYPQQPPQQQQPYPQQSSQQQQPYPQQPQQGLALQPPAAGSEHDAMVGRFGVGFMGVQTVPIQPVPQLGNMAAIDAPVVGMRYWFDRMVGLDAGLGLRLQGGDAPAQTAVVLHAGVPLSLASAGHFSFQVVPELNLGFGNMATSVAGGDISSRTFLVQAGARAGAEIHFGFIGVPQLALQGSVGARFVYRASTIKARNAAGVEASTSADEYYFATSYGSGNNPWDIFQGNVSALYYF